jgi:omega-hydroxy-beta-dihydromenaquinone-9 sulfotransferase
MGLVAGQPKWIDWSPRIWLGCDLFAWLRLLWLGRFRFGWQEFRLLPIGTMFAAGHTLLRYAQEQQFGDAIRATRLAEPPVFILGHWRSGTTLLHELLVQDPRHNFPNTYQCFDPCHFLLTEKLIRRYFTWILPETRAIDNMAVGWDRPQEDEFALALLGAPSPYNGIAFPNCGQLDADAFDLDNLPPRVRDHWKRTLLWFLKAIALRDPRRLILKSPPHTCRVPTLLEMFPDARFIHIVRDPFAVYSSTMNLWKTLFRTQGLHRPNPAGNEEDVFEMFLHFHRRLDSTRQLIPDGRFHELKFEDLTRDPVGEIGRLYDRLDLGDFESVRPHVERYLTENARYERNKWELTPEKRAEIALRWASVIEKHGYGE